MQDWQKWHAPYDDASSPLSRRLAIVQQYISSWLDERVGEEVTIVSSCAEEGRDVLGVLAARSDSARVRVTLIESDSRNASVARDAARAACLDRILVLEADAGELSTYGSAVPADLVVMVGVFGNISDDDVRKTVFALPRLCAAHAKVIWSRSASLTGQRIEHERPARSGAI